MEASSRYCSLNLQLSRRHSYLVSILGKHQKKKVHRKCLSFQSSPIQRQAYAPRTASVPLLNINNALQQVLQAMIVSIYLNSQLLPFLKGTLNYGWEQTMLSDGNISIKEQIPFFRNTVRCAKFPDEISDDANFDNVEIIYSQLSEFLLFFLLWQQYVSGLIFN